MKALDSRALLAAYAREKSEAAFRELVARYIDLVYSTAVRLAGGDTHFAEDVAQTVFIDLARKAPGLSTQVMLGGWLHRRTCHVAATMLRSERRRRQREKQAMDQEILQDHAHSTLAQVAPILDDAINQLNAADRAAIILRFFEQRDFRAVGQALNSTEDAARMRVSRALDKLHFHLNRRGVTLSAAALGTALAAEVTTAAPAGLASTFAGTALAKAALGGGLPPLLGNIFATAKAKALLAGVVGIAALGTLLMAERQKQFQFAQAKLRQENEALRAEVQEAQELARQRQAQAEAYMSELQRLRQGQSDLLRLRGEVGRLRRQLEAASLQTNQTAPAAPEKDASTNLLSGFTPLRASVRSRLASGQALVVGGWPGHQGERLLVLAVPRITGEDADVAVAFTAMELPERLLADFGLDGLRVQSSSSALSAVLPAAQLQALQKRLDQLFQERLQKIDNGGADAAESGGETLNRLGLGTVTSTNGQPVSLNYIVAAYGDTWTGVAEPDGTNGSNLTAAGLDLGPYRGPAFTVTPVILNDGNSIDLRLEATIFKRFEGTF